MSIDLPSEKMTLAEKLETMELLWADISKKPADLREVLEERRRLVSEGKLKFLTSGGSYAEIRLLEAAREVLREGWNFYERSSAGLGEYFLDCIQADVRSLTIYAGIHETADGFHRMLIKRFPSPFIT